MMKYKAIIITGTEDSGASIVAKKLCAASADFQIVPVVTTRIKDSYDQENQYEYLTKEQFDALAEKNELLFKIEHQKTSYGIKKDSSKLAKERNKTPVIVLSPTDFLCELIKQSRDLFSVFVGTPADILGNRSMGAKETIASGILEKRKENRELALFCTYALENLDPQKAVALILALWEYRDNGGIVPRRLIRLAIDCGMLLQGVDDDRKIKGASYDLSLGDEYYYGGQIKTLTDKDPFICIEPYDYAIVTSKENANFPRDIAARFDLSVSLFCQGVILSNGPQVDPGFKGKLFCLLFNTSNAVVVLKHGQHYATLEFHKLLEPTDPYGGQYQDKTGIVDYLPSNTLKGAVNELKKELEEVKSQGQGLQTTILGMLSILLVIIAILLALR